MTRLFWSLLPLGMILACTRTQTYPVSGYQQFNAQLRYLPNAKRCLSKDPNLVNMIKLQPSMRLSFHYYEKCGMPIGSPSIAAPKSDRQPLPAPQSNCVSPPALSEYKWVIPNPPYHYEDYFVVNYLRFLAGYQEGNAEKYRDLAANAKSFKTIDEIDEKVLALTIDSLNIELAHAQVQQVNVQTNLEECSAEWLMKNMSRPPHSDIDSVFPFRTLLFSIPDNQGNKSDHRTFLWNNSFLNLPATRDATYKYTWPCAYVDIEIPIYTNDVLEPMYVPIYFSVDDFEAKIGRRVVGIERSLRFAGKFALADGSSIDCTQPVQAAAKGNPGEPGCHVIAGNRPQRFALWFHKDRRLPVPLGALLISSSEKKRLTLAPGDLLVTDNGQPQAEDARKDDGR